MGSMTYINAGVIGVGNKGEDHLKKYKRYDDVKINSVCEPNKKRANEISDLYDVDVYGTADQLFEAESENIDMVSICSPPSFHFDQAVTAIKNGTNVLIEKPMVVSLDQANQLQEYKTEYGSEIVTKHNRIKKGTSTREAIEAANAGEIGDILAIKDVKYTSTGRFESTSDHWVHKLPGGRFTEHISHHIYPSYKLIGDMELISVDAKKTIDDFPWLHFNKLSLELESKHNSTEIEVEILNDPNITGGVYDLIIIGTEGIIHDNGRNFFTKYSNESIVLNNSTINSYKTSVKKHPGDQLKNIIQGTIDDLKWSIDGITHKLKSELGQSPNAKFILKKDTERQFVDYLKGEDDIPTPWDEAYETIRLNLEVANELETLIDRS